MACKSLNLTKIALSSPNPKNKSSQCLTRWQWDTLRHASRHTTRNTRDECHRECNEGTSGALATSSSSRRGRASWRWVVACCSAARSPRHLASQELRWKPNWLASSDTDSTGRLLLWDHHPGASSASNACVARDVWSTSSQSLFQKKTRIIFGQIKCTKFIASNDKYIDRSNIAYNLRCDWQWASQLQHIHSTKQFFSYK